MPTRHDNPLPQGNTDTPTTAPPMPIHGTVPMRVLLLLCIVLPTLVFIVAANYRLRQMTADTEVRLDRALRIAQEHALKVFDTNEMLLLHMQDLLDADDEREILEHERQWHDRMRNVLHGKRQFQSAWIFSAGARPLATSIAYPAPRELDVSDREDFRWHRDNRGGIFFTAPLSGSSGQGAFIDLSVGRYGADGAFNGLISTSLDPSYFTQFYADLVADEPGLAVTLLRADGAVYARWPELPGGPSRLSPNSPVMRSIAAGNDSGAMRGVSSLDGRERLLTYRRIGEYPVYVGTGMDLGVIHAAWVREMVSWAAFGLPAVVGLLFAVYLASRRTRQVLRAMQLHQQEVEARQQVEKALLQAQKLEALGRLTGGVAHDFNNALAVILANLFLLRKKYPESDQKLLLAIQHAVDSATKLTRQLLAFSRNQPMMPERVALRQRLDAIGELLVPVLGSAIRLDIDVAPDTAAVFVDAAEFELALLNLAINARDAMPDGGQLTVRAAEASAPLPDGLQGRFVVVSVTDTGTGIAPEQLTKVFEPFFTTKPTGVGTGLGLSQVYGLAQRAGGTATIDSTLGQGTTVRMYLPASGDEDPVERSRPELPNEPLDMSVLLVEDNQAVAGAVRPLLESMGCRVTWLDSGDQARDWLQTPGRQLPDVLLTDVVMPGSMDGKALAEHVRRNFPDIAIVVMTGYAERYDAIASQGFEILPKPSTAEALAGAIQKVTRKRPQADAGNAAAH